MPPAASAGRETRVEAGRVDPVKAVQRGNPQGEFDSLGVQEPGAEGLERTRVRRPTVPESPQPTRTRRAPASSAARISSPTP
ncbi:hypothetical protein Shyd_83670 [Streptomyces hydrogenans]|uniref:Uncharacterized protein n=1 Tax=Streptomyces hydrogenans TaxID=1873719 RepID=A0ABQ3PPN8_9ACTN|nr:hypothetical protein Shyd_83670 [Streptomyces hydrogenans]